MTRRGLLLALIGLGGAAAALAAAPAYAQPTEEAVKAAFIPKFARYVTWPRGAAPAPGQPYRLCVIGRDPFGRLLDQAAASEIVDGRGFQVRRVSGSDEAGGCHLAFVQGQDTAETARLLAALRGRAMLTVTDARSGTARGMIHFTVAAGRVRFFIDEAEASRQGLSISSRLLALALGVRQRRT